MSDSRRFWTAEREALLREMYPAASWEAMQEALGASQAAIQTFAARNGIKRPAAESRLLNLICEGCGKSFQAYMTSAGKPQRFCSRACQRQTAKFDVQGDVTVVHLTRGYTTVIDTADLPLIRDFGWSVRNVNMGIPYAFSQRGGHMHRLIMACPDDMCVDHIDRDGLNNRRANLRIATPEQNGFNRSKRKTVNASSKYKGVSKNPRANSWCVVVRGKYYCSRPTEKEAAREYDRIALEIYGEFAATNRSIYPEDF